METYCKHRGNPALRTQKIVHSQIYGGKKLTPLPDSRGGRYGKKCIGLEITKHMFVCLI